VSDEPPSLARRRSRVGIGPSGGALRLSGVDDPHVCSACRRAIVGEHVSTEIYAVQQVEVSAAGFGQAREYVDGAEAWFHFWCYRGKPHYRRLPPPSYASRYTAA
jgi:hypothetical protein